MELSPRKQAVLKAIVKAYIETGEPIGSKNLTLLLENAPSSATLRNEMSELCELGLLHQPHTSAGRIPTNKGYRLYVNSLMNIPQLSDRSVEFIENNVAAIRSEPESIPRVTAEIISHFTGLPAFSCLITEKVPRIKRIELLPIGKYSLMLLVITDDGRTRNRVFRQGKNFTPEINNIFNELINRRVKGKPVDELTKAYMQTVIAESGLYALQLMPLFTAVFETAGEIKTVDISLAGENQLYNMCNEKTARGISSLFGYGDAVMPILQNSTKNVDVIFGEDTNYSELYSNIIVTAEFKGAEKYKGYIGVIGPNRISYEQIMPIIEYTAKKLTTIMTEAQKDMED